MSEKKLVGQTKVMVEGNPTIVDVYSDKTFILPDGTVASLSDDSYKKVLEKTKEERRRRASEGVRKNEPEKSAAVEATNKKKKRKGPMTEAEKEARKEEIRLKREAEEERRKTEKRKKQLLAEDGVVSKEKNKKLIAGIVYILSLVAILFLAKLFLNSQAETVQVVRLSNQVVSGDLLLESDLEPFTMLKSEVTSASNLIEWKNDGSNLFYIYCDLNDMTDAQTQAAWEEYQEDKESLAVYSAAYLQAGQFLTMSSVTSESVVRNPWLASVEDDQEIYTLSFDASDLTLSLLMPGTHLRARLIVDASELTTTTTSVDAYVNPFATSALSEDEYYAEEYVSVPEPVVTYDEVEEDEDGNKNDLNISAVEEAGVELPFSTIIFDNVVAIDMINSSGESIFEIYMALLALPIDERIEYLETRMETNELALEFQARVTPVQLVLALNEEQATNMTKFEHIDGTIKWTILKEVDDSEIMDSLMEVSTQLSDLFSEVLSDESLV